MELLKNNQIFNGNKGQNPQQGDEFNRIQRLFEIICDLLRGLLVKIS